MKSDAININVFFTRKEQGMRLDACAKCLHDLVGLPLMRKTFIDQRRSNSRTRRFVSLFGVRRPQPQAGRSHATGNHMRLANLAGDLPESTLGSWEESEDGKVGIPITESIAGLPDGGKWG